MENARIADILDEIAELLELTEADPFRIRSYQAAARTVRGLSRRLEDLVAEGADLTEIPSIGKSTAGKIEEILETGTCKRIEELRRDVPPALTALLDVPRLGPRKAMQLYRELGIESIEDLRRACEKHEVRELEGMGAKTEENILRGIETVSSAAGRFLLSDAEGQVEALSRELAGISAITRFEVAGSYRRRKETVGDLDVLVRAKDRKAAAKGITTMSSVDKVDLSGEEKVTVHLKSGIQVDFRFFDPESFGAALAYFTGSKEHNVALRRRAQDKGWKLNEYGLMKGDERLAGKDEESIYARLKLPWIPPELRENRGEIEAAEKGGLPDLVDEKAIKGDLHSHTTATDGTATIQEMAKAAKDMGYAYLAVTDHSKRVTIASGLDNEEMRRHAEEIRKANSKIEGIRLFAGVEVDILKGGKLDLADDVLDDLDWVNASVHFDRSMSVKEMTQRILVAARSGLVDCISHPLGRMIGRREILEFDFDAVCESCAERGVALEVNSQPERLDLPDTYVKRAIDAGVLLSIATDAHRTTDFGFIRYGVGIARRGWATKKDVLNTRTGAQMVKWLEGRRGGAKGSSGGKRAKTAAHAKSR